MTIELTFDEPSLQYDGDETVTADGYTYTLEIEPDPWGGTYGDDDCDMQIAQVTASWDVYHQRPTGFDGAAFKIRTNYGVTYWAQPRFDVWGLPRRDWHNDPEMRRREHDHAKNVLEDGYLCVSVTMRAPDGSVTSGALGGVESDADDDYLKTIISECVGECQSEHVLRLRRQQAGLCPALTPV